LVLAASPLSTQHYEVKNPGWLQIRIMCPSGMACLPVDSCF
jgi:hypothetical protein